MPKRVLLSGGGSATYIYDASGVKYKVIYQGGGENKNTEYSSNVIYENGELDKVFTEEGYITFNGSIPTYHYYLTDHLGNNRVVMNQDGTIEQVNHYYPFGGLFDQTAEDLQAYKYNGKELDRTYGLDLYDYSARYMDPPLGRFTTIDPLAEKYYSISPYAYCANNPVRFVDPTGMVYRESDTLWERIRKSVNHLVSSLLYGTGFHPQQMHSEDQAIQQDANQRRETTIETLHTVNETLLSVVPGGDVAYKTLNDREISNTDYVWTAAEITPIVKLGKIAKKGASIWTKTSKLTAVENALKHWNKHGKEFSEFQNAKQYVEGTKDFLHNSPSGTLVKIRPNGDVLKYHPKTNTFGIMDANGTPRTMFKPSDGMKYWLKQ